MKRYHKIFFLSSIGALVLILFSIYFYFKYELYCYRIFIENEYKDIFALIENEMQNRKGVTGIDEVERVISKDKEIEKALSLPDIYSASWSSDGHHGFASLKRSSGYQISKTISSVNSQNSHILFWGNADNGNQLLLFIGKVPNGFKKVYKIAFLLSEVQHKMKEKQSSKLEKTADN